MSKVRKLVMDFSEGYMVLGPCLNTFFIYGLGTLPVRLRLRLKVILESG